MVNEAMDAVLAAEAVPAPDYSHIWSAITGSAWAIQPAKLDAMMAVLQRRTDGLRLSHAEIRAVIGPSSGGMEPEAAAPMNGARQAGGVAVLQLYGVIAQRMGLLAESSGGTSTQRFAQAFREALGDASIGAIVIDVDSPGGSVFGVAELAAEIFAARGQKPVIAVANSLAASAAYWIGTAADSLSVTPSGQVGSIGVLGMRQDRTKLEERMGIKTTIVSAGRFKAEGHPAVPITEEELAAAQADVDAYHAMFVDAVARHRGTSASAVRSGYGEGRVLGAKAALAAGMVDRIETLDAAINRMRRRPSSGGARVEAESIMPTAEAAPIVVGDEIEPAVAASGVDPDIARRQRRLRMAGVA